jgi:hypothetical protein
MGQWRLDIHIDIGANGFVRGEAADGGTKIGDAGRPGIRIVNKSELVGP